MNNLIQKLFAIVAILLSLPVIVILYLIVKLTSPGPFIFKQARMGKNKKQFMMYKVRTMIEDAERLKGKYENMNEMDGPVFKIKNDPRYTRVGKYISKFALDEIPQFVNVIKGEMAIVGPRPLPVYEAKKVPNKYSLRFSVKPGMTSPWIIKGAHKLGFKKWMELDLDYVKRKNFWYDIFVFIKTVALIVNLFFLKNHGQKI